MMLTRRSKIEDVCAGGFILTLDIFVQQILCQEFRVKNLVSRIKCNKFFLKNLVSKILCQEFRVKNKFRNFCPDNVSLKNCVQTKNESPGPCQSNLGNIPCLPSQPVVPFD